MKYFKRLFELPKDLLITVAIALVILVSSCNSAIAATSTVSCKGAYSQDCPIVVEMQLNQEAVYLEAANNFSMHWCNGWNNLECYLTGTYKVIDGEITLRQMFENNATIKTKKVSVQCFRVFGPGGCSVKN